MLRLSILLLLTVVAATACGGSSKHAATTTSTVTGDDGAGQGYVAAGNQVCVRSDKRIYKIGRLSRNPKGWQRTADAARTGLAEMKKVQPPQARAAAFRQMLHYANALTLAIQQVHDSLVKSNYDTASAAQFAAAQLQDKVHQAARSAGLTFCQQPLTNWPA